MPHGPESGDKKIDVLGTPARLRQGEYRQDQQRRTNIKQQVTPAIQDPKIRTRPCGGNCRNGLWPRKSGNVLHVEERANYSLEVLKINGCLSFLREFRRRSTPMLAVFRRSAKVWLIWRWKGRRQG